MRTLIFIIFILTKTFYGQKTSEYLFSSTGDTILLPLSGLNDKMTIGILKKENSTKTKEIYSFNVYHQNGIFSIPADVIEKYKLNEKGDRISADSLKGLIVKQKSTRTRKKAKSSLDTTKYIFITNWTISITFEGQTLLKNFSVQQEYENSKPESFQMTKSILVPRVIKMKNSDKFLITINIFQCTIGEKGKNFETVYQSTHRI